MKVRCIKEAETKGLLKFTKGNIYEATKFDDLEYMVLDDEGNKECFFNLDRMFEIVEI